MHKLHVVLVHELHALHINAIAFVHDLHVLHVILEQVLHELPDANIFAGEEQD